MKMGLTAPDLKRNFDERVEARDSLRAEIGGRVESNAVNTFKQASGFGKQLSTPTVGVGLLGRHLAPCTRGFAKMQAHWDCWRGLAARGVQDMSRDALHIPSHFFRRSCVICRCCSAASQSSVFSSFCIR